MITLINKKEKVMTSQKIIERLKQKNWFIKVKNDHELALVYNACIDAKITWQDGDSIKKCDLLGLGRKSNVFVKFILFRKNRVGIAWDSRITQTGEKNITDWFFKEIKNENT